MRSCGGMGEPAIASCSSFSQLQARLAGEPILKKRMREQNEPFLVAYLLCCTTGSLSPTYDDRHFYQSVTREQSLQEYESK